jgi:oligopeptide transport system substrate-binding protein
MAVIMLMALSGLPGCSRPQFERDEKPPRPGIFRFNLGTEPPEIDPAKTSDLISEEVIEPLLKGLTSFDEHMLPQPAIAESWTLSADHRHYVFHLRPNAYWSDGKPVVAEDFVYAWKRVLTPETGAPSAFFLYPIKNAKAYYDGKIKDFKQVGVHAAAPKMLVVDLEQPVPFFLSLAAMPVMMPLRQDSIEKYGEGFVEAGHFISNGAYVLKKWAHEEKITLTPNPYFYDAKTPGKHPLVKQVEMLMVNDANTSVVMYENRELDFIETSTSIPAFDVRRLKSRPDAHTSPLYRINYFGFNIKKPPFNDVRVRQALAYALDRSAYPKLLQSGQEPMASWVAEGLLGYNKNIGLPYDPEKAKKLLAEAGYPDGKGFPKTSLSYQTIYDVRKEAEIAQALWKKNLNIDIHLDNMEWKMLLSRLAQDPPALYRLGWFADYPDADSFMGVFLSDSGNNYTQWKSAAYDQWVHRAAISTDDTVRKSLYDQAQRLLLEQETVMIPSYSASKFYLLRPYVKGLGLNALNLLNFDTLQVGEPVKN